VGDDPAVVGSHFETKHKGYYRADRSELIDFFAQHRPFSGRALDVGCGEGGLGRELLRRGFTEVHGIEPVPAIADKARADLTTVFEGTFQSVDRDALGAFDLIIFADSLEHMIDPWAALTQAREMLTPNGAVLLSVPNVAHWTVLWRALKLGRWDYTDEGLLDRTHLRFFTPATLVESLRAAGFLVLASKGREKPLPKNRRWVRPVLKRVWPHVLVFQEYIVAVPSEGIVSKQ